MSKNRIKIIIIGMIVTVIFLILSITNGISTQTIKKMDNTLAVNIFPKLSKNTIPVVYEGDIVSCDITGTPLYWTINNQSHHYTFDKNNNPIIYDPEQTPLDQQTVILTVYALDKFGKEVFSTKEIILKKLFFGDIHWHSNFSDGDYDIEDIYKNAKKDRYLDFTAATDQKEAIPPLLYKLKKLIKKRRPNEIKDPWDISKKVAKKYYEEGVFSTILGFEWSGSNMYPGGKKYTPHGCEDVSHINFYYRELYDKADHYSTFDKKTYDEILTAMNDEYNAGHKNIGYPHHPQGKIYLFSSTLVNNFEIFKDIKFLQRFLYDFTTNFTFLAKDVQNKQAINKIIRGAEIFSRWGAAIGPYSNIDIPWPYYKDNPEDGVVCANKKEAWAENAMWEWSENVDKNAKFALQMGSDTHHTTRPGSAFLWRKKTSGITAAYAVHNKREEIWDAMNDCDIYGTQLLKIKANVRFDNKMALGKWIDCSKSYLKIDISAMSAVERNDYSGKKIKPYDYPEDDSLDYPIKEIYIIKKDTEKGQPWCKVINHTVFNKKNEDNLVTLSFTDDKVKPNDFYYIVIKQEAAELFNGDEKYDAQNEYTAILGPVFIRSVSS